jgi:hypothetical protein
MEEDHFYAMLGFGPIGEGYSLIASREHKPSMLDLGAEAAIELERFTRDVRARLEPIYGECSIGEHGRVALCIERPTVAHEPHCMHAHRLVFPGLAELPLAAVVTEAPIQSLPSSIEVFDSFIPSGQYLYSETPDGACEIASVSRPVPRQTLRRLAANLRGEPPEHADWQAHPDMTRVQAAQENLGIR